MTTTHAASSDGLSMADAALAAIPRHSAWAGPSALDIAHPVLCFFDWPRTATVDDEDENGHVSNVAWVRYIQDATRAHSDAIGLDRAAYERIGGTFIVKRHEVDYRQGSRAGDELVVTTTVEEIRVASAVRRTRIIRLSDGAEILKARTEWVFVSIAGHRPLRIPTEVMVAFELVGKLNRGRRERDAV
jgi:acyl-CoA thioester hydrolase